MTSNVYLPLTNCNTSETSPSKNAPIRKISFVLQNQPFLDDFSDWLYRPKFVMDQPASWGWVRKQQSQAHVMMKPMLPGPYVHICVFIYYLFIFI